MKQTPTKEKTPRIRTMSHMSPEKPRDFTPFRGYYAPGRLSQSERKPHFEAPATRSSCRKRLRVASTENINKENQDDILGSTSGLTEYEDAIEDIEEQETVTEEIRSDETVHALTESLIKFFYEGVYPIDAQFVGGELSIMKGTQESATRINKKFQIMKKLGILVGCGLDSHFRMLEPGFELWMLVRGTPKSVFGASTKVIPELANIQKLACPQDLLESAQRAFFISILQLLPNRLVGGREVLLDAFENCKEEKMTKFYEFLKNIRFQVSTSLATIPIAWAVPDSSNNTEKIVAEEIRNTMQLCGDNQLMALEQKQPGFTEAWKQDLGVAASASLSKLMDELLEYNSDF